MLSIKSITLILLLKLSKSSIFSQFFKIKLHIIYKMYILKQSF